MNDNPNYPQLHVFNNQLRVFNNQLHVFNNQLMVFGSRNPNVIEYWDGTKWQIAFGQALTKIIMNGGFQYL